MADSSLASIITLLTAVVILFTAVRAAREARKAKLVASDVQRDVQQIVVNVNGRLSEMLEMNQILTSRVNQLTTSLQGSDTEVPDEPAVVKVIVADQPQESPPSE